MFPQNIQRPPWPTPYMGNPFGLDMQKCMDNDMCTSWAQRRMYFGGGRPSQQQGGSGSTGSDSGSGSADSGSVDSGSSTTDAGDASSSSSNNAASSDTSSSSASNTNNS